LISQPFELNSSKPDKTHEPINANDLFQDRWDTNHVKMPCSPSNVTVGD